MSLSNMKTILLGMMMFSVNLIPGETIVYVNQGAETTFQVVTAQVSAYTSSKDETDDTPHLTASGSKTREGIVACPSRLEFGTKIEIEGKAFVCEDRMNKRYRDREVYDIWVSSKEVAYEWGRKTLDIKIYE